MQNGDVWCKDVAKTIAEMSSFWWIWIETDVKTIWICHSQMGKIKIVIIFTMSVLTRMRPLHSKIFFKKHWFLAFEVNSVVSQNCTFFPMLAHCVMAVFWAMPGGWEIRKTAESCFDPCHILSKRVELGVLNWTFRELFWSNLPAAEDLLLLMFLLLGKQKIEIYKKIT